MPPMWASYQTVLGAVTAVCLRAKYICLFIIYLCHNSLGLNQTHGCLMHPILFHLVYPAFQTHNQLCKLAVWHSIGSHINHGWFVSFVCWIPKTIMCVCLHLSFQISSLIWTSVLENAAQKCLWLVFFVLSVVDCFSNWEQSFICLLKMNTLLWHENMNLPK